MVVPSVNRDKCIGCGLCTSICADVFEIADDGKARVKNPKGCGKCDCKEAADSCPVQAISLK